MLRRNKKYLNLGPKGPYFGIFDQKCDIWVFFGQSFKNTIAIFEVCTLKFVKNESLTHTVNFGIKSTFSNGPGFAFSEGLGPGPDPLNKGCPFKNTC